MQIHGYVQMNDGSQKRFAANNADKALKAAAQILKIPCLTARNLEKSRAKFVHYGDGIIFPVNGKRGLDKPETIRFRRSEGRRRGIHARQQLAFAA